MKLFDRTKLKIKPLAERESKSDLSILIDPLSKPPHINKEEISQLEQVASSIKKSRKNKAPIVFAFGAHSIKNGLSNIIIRMMKEDYIRHILANEAFVIHDWELAFQGKTEEDVKKYISEGQFGLWDETGLCLNAAIKLGAKSNTGYGQSVGGMINREGICDIRIPHPHKSISVLGNAYELDIPVSIGVTIGQNIHHTHPRFSGEMTGKVGDIDFLKFVDTIYNLENGTYLSVGSAILSPQIFEKALSMAKNVAKQENKKLENYNIFVNDIQEGKWDWSKGEPPKDNPAYYLRFMKTFSRMGGASKYIQMDNRTFLHNLYYLLK